MAAVLANTLTGATARAQLRKLVGELRVQTKDGAVEVWSTQIAEQALVRLAGGFQQM
jgi:hypothetical protein